MAKKKVVAEVSEATEVDSDIEETEEVQVKPPVEMFNVVLPCWININGKTYEAGQPYLVPVDTARLLNHMAQERVKREDSVHHGNRFEVERTLKGNRVRHMGRM